MRAGHATLGTNTALSEWDASAPSSARQRRRWQKPRHERNNLHPGLLFLPSARLSGPIWVIRETKECAGTAHVTDQSVNTALKDETYLLCIFRLHFFTCLPGLVEECDPLLLSSFSVSISLLPVLPSVSTSTWTALFAGSVQTEQTINVTSVGWTKMHFSVQRWRRRESKPQGGIWNDRRGTAASRLSRWDTKDHMLHFVYRAVTFSAKFGQWKRIYTLAQSLPTEYLNEILTVPEATRSHSPLHSIWCIHAVFPTASFIFLKAGSILHSPTHPPS